MEALASVLNLVMQPCYALTGNWWAAIALFTVICKIVLMPLSLWCQKNSIVMVTVMPAVNRLKVQYYGDAETIGEKQNALYKEKGYHPLLSLIPLAVQVVILFGLVDVIHGVTDGGAPGTEFLGLVPTEDGGLSWIMPLLAGLSAFVLGAAQNRINPLQKEQSRAEKNSTNGLSVALSLVLGVFVSAGMAFYWICSNLMAIVVQVLCNVLVKPSKYIDYVELEESRKELEALESLVEKRKWYQRDPLAKREKRDYDRFFNVVGKHIVYYSEGSNFYRFFQGSIEYLLENSNVTIHYVTNDPDDVIFGLAKEQSRIQPYFVREKRAITLMMKMDADVVVLSQDDLDNYYIKRSYVRKDIEYVYSPHHLTSFYLTGWKHGYDHFDTILCTGPDQVAELRRGEEIYGLPRKNLVEVGYDMLDRSIAREASVEKVVNEQPVICIGPSWQEANILDSCIDDLVKALAGNGYRIVVRPHPEYVKRYRPRWDALKARVREYGPESEIVFEDDYSKPSSANIADILITDWSTISYDFSFSKLKPSVYINTPMKVNNPDWQDLGMTPTDISLRDQTGVSFAMEDAGKIGPTVAQMLANPDEWSDRILGIRKAFLFNEGHGGQVAGEYLLGRILAKQEQAASGGAAQGGARAGAAAETAKAGDDAAPVCGNVAAAAGLAPAVAAGEGGDCRG